MPIFVVVSLSLLQALLVLVHFAIYRTIAWVLGINSWAFEGFFVALAFTFIIASVLAFRVHSKFATLFYMFAAYWFGLAFFIFVGVVVFFFSIAALYVTNHYVPPNILLGMALSMVFLLHLYGTLESTSAHIRRVKIAIPNLPEAWRGKTVAFVSDLHFGAVHRRHFAKKITRRLLKIAPDIVLIGGDMFDGVKCNPVRDMEPFHVVKPPHGMYFITGNHDYYFSDWATTGKKAIEDVGIKILNDEAVVLDGIQFAGIDYKTGTKPEMIDAALAKMKLTRSMPSILIKHEPNHLENIERTGVTLELSGHTHNGQIFPLNYIARRIYGQFVYGLSRLGNMQVYTSSGVGTWGPPLRLATRSEIVAIELTNAS